ncbi:MAG TPA: sigma factor [Puia sp.]|nr:sigma factor [Puia sp.]
MDEQDEHAVSINDLREGSPQAFKELFFQYYPEFFSFAYSLLGDQVSARSRTMDTFFLLWKKRAHFDNEKDGKAFLYNTLRNSCINYLNYLQKNPGVTKYFPEIKMDTDFPDSTLRELLAYVAKVT